MALQANQIHEEQPAIIPEDRLREAEKYIEEEEGVTRAITCHKPNFTVKSKSTHASCK